MDLYDYVPVERVRKAMLADSKFAGSVKQFRVTEWEQKLLPVIAHDLGLRRYHLLHPSRMYHALNGWWGNTLSAHEALQQLAFDPIVAPHPPLTLPLPDRFVAVRFYARHTWPMNEDLKGWTANLVDRIAKKLPVVLLDSGLHADDHCDFPLSGPNITTIASACTPTTNLAVQSAVIAKSQAFVGTYGGTMQLAVRLKRPAMGFYHEFGGTAYAHKDLTERLALLQGVPCWIGTPKDSQFVHEVVG